MKGGLKKIEDWLWVILLVAALVYFHWLLGSLHAENEKLKDAQEEFSKEIEIRYQKTKELQAEIQSNLNETTKELLEFLHVTSSSRYFEETP